jgi:hypothetical protein
MTGCRVERGDRPQKLRDLFALFDARTVPHAYRAAWHLYDQQLLSLTW